MVHADHLGRPIRVTNGSGGTVWQAVYKPFGEVQSTSGTASNDLRFPDQFFEIETGLAYNWYRHYDPLTGRYTQPDPLRFVDGPSVFAYAGGSPFIYVDPKGHSYAIVGGIFGGIGGAIGGGLVGEGFGAIPGAIERFDAGYDLGLAADVAAAAAAGDLPNSQAQSSTPKVCTASDPEGNGGGGSNDPCEKAKQKASSIYHNLMNKRIPQYLNSSTPTEGHYVAIGQKQNGLKKALQDVAKNCKEVPVDYDSWQNAADMTIDVRH